MSETLRYGGIDVSKLWLDVAVWPGEAQARFASDPPGLAALAAWLGERGWAGSAWRPPAATNGV